MLDAATELVDLQDPPGNRLRNCEAIDRDSTASALTISTAFASCGAITMHTKWK
jgi:hypothetical protein